ncbi:MAG: matrixin family metalloprotease, partial [Mycobacteriales bacterium]
AGATVSAAALPERLAAGSCDRADVIIRDGAAGVALPARGITVSAAVLTLDGDQLLAVARELDGSLTIRRGEAARTAPVAPTSASSACTSSAFVDLGYQVGGGYAWKYNGKGAPANVAGSALANLKTATANITSGRDDCGIAGKPRTGQSFTGTTTAAPGITTDARCAPNPDQVNITGWKALSASGVLAVTCTYSFTGSHDVADSDAAINSKFRWATSPSGCNNAYDLQGVMTHERGHTFGLGHPAATSANQGLTMYPSVRACDFSIRTLGKGDLLGLFNIYGKA